MKVLVKASEDPLRELLRNIKRESMGPQDARELLQYFGDMNTTFENREGERRVSGGGSLGRFIFYGGVN